MSHKLQPWCEATRISSTSAAAAFGSITRSCLATAMSSVKAGTLATAATAALVLSVAAARCTKDSPSCCCNTA